MGNEVDQIRKLNFGYVSESELIDIFNQNKDNYRILLNLVKHPKFPEKLSIDVISKLFSIDLLRVIKNKRTRPYVRKKAEIEFVQRYNRFPLGEKLSYMKIAPNSLLNYFIEENDRKVLNVMLKNSYCKEEFVLKFFFRKTPKYNFYEALGSTEWPKRPAIANAIVNDKEAPIKIVLDVIPLLNIGNLKKIYKRESSHQIIKKNIINYLKQRKSE